ncbi:MAG: DsbA family protein [Salaquimonas sp.]
MKATRRNLLLSSGAIFATGASAWWLGSGRPLEMITPAKAQSASGVMEAGPLPDVFLGKDDAPVTIIEYASMTCPHCANFHESILPSIKEKFIETGKVKMIFREFPLDPRAYAASMLARCAEEDFFFPMIDVLFKQQSVWARAEDPRPPLLQIAKLAGFTQESFEVCLKNQELLDNVNSTRKKAAEVYGVNSTPSFFINGEKYSGAISVEGLSEAIENLL